MTESLAARLKKNAKRKLKEELERDEERRRNQRSPEQVLKDERLSQIRREAALKGHVTQRVLAEIHKENVEQRQLADEYKRRLQDEEVERLYGAAKLIEDPLKPKPWEKDFGPAKSNGSGYTEVEVEEEDTEAQLKEFHEQVKRMQEKRKAEIAELEKDKIRDDLEKLEE